MAKNQTKALTREAAWKAKQMYQELDNRGRRKWTLQALAEYFICGETTIYRAVNSLGPYASLPEVKSEEELQRAAADSLAKLQKMLAEPAPVGNPLAAPVMPMSEETAATLRAFGAGRIADAAVVAAPLKLAPRAIPPDPLSGGEGGEGDSPESALERMERAMQEQSPDKLLEELKGEGK